MGGSPIRVLDNEGEGVHGRAQDIVDYESE